MTDIGPPIAFRPLEYLSRQELSRLDERFDAVLQNAGCLVFWTGISCELAQRWANQHGLQTLVSAMGPMFSNRDAGGPRHGKSSKAWSKYMKGASIRFAEYACRGRRVIVLTNPPPDIYSPRKRSSYRHLEEPILKGAIADTSTVRIDCVHPTVVGASTFQYQIWPIDKSIEWFTFIRCLSLKRPGTLYVKQIARTDDKLIDIIQLQAIVIPVELAQKDQAATCQKELRRKNAELEQREAQGKKRLKRLRAELQQREAQEKKRLKRQRAELEQQKAQEKRRVKLQRAELEQQKAQEKERVKRQRAELEQREAQKKKRLKRQRAELEQHKAQEKKRVKLQRAELERQKAQERDRVKRQRAEVEKQKA